VSKEVGVIGRLVEVKKGGWSIDCFSRTGLNTKCVLNHAPSLVIIIIGGKWRRKERILRRGR
jgi:hypothetical protein